MAEMLVQSPEVKKVLFDYDFTFDTGMVLPLSLDPTIGDTIVLGDHVIQVHIEPRPSLSNPDTILPGEDFTIFTSHVLAIQKRKREVTELSPEEKIGWGKMMEELSKTVQ